MNKVAVIGLNRRMQAAFGAALALVLLTGCVTTGVTAQRDRVSKAMELYRSDIYTIDIIVDYFDGLTFSSRGDAGDYASWPTYIQFMGRTDINQFVNRLALDNLIYVDARIDRKKFGWADKFHTHFASFTNTNLLHTQLPVYQKDANLLVLRADSRTDLAQMRAAALAQYAGVLKSPGPYERQTYIGRVRNIISVFTSAKQTENGCVWMGAIDKSHVIRSGVVIIADDLHWDEWRRCYMRGLMRLGGQLGEVFKHPSVMRGDSNYVMVSHYQGVSMRQLYVSEFKWTEVLLKFENGAPRAEAVFAVEKRHRDDLPVMRKKYSEENSTE